MTLKKRALVEYSILKMYWWKLILICIYLFYVLTVPVKNLCLYFNDLNEDTQVIDLAHKLFPEYYKHNIQDYPQPFIWISAFIFGFLIPLFYSPCHEKKIFGMRNVIATMLISGILYTIRSIVNLVTIMPSPNHVCRAHIAKKPHTVYGKDFSSF